MTTIWQLYEAGASAASQTYICHSTAELKNGTFSEQNVDNYIKLVLALPHTQTSFDSLGLLTIRATRTEDRFRKCTFLINSLRGKHWVWSFEKPCTSLIILSWENQSFKDLFWVFAWESWSIECSKAPSKVYLFLTVQLCDWLSQLSKLKCQGYVLSNFPCLIGKGSPCEHSTQCPCCGCITSIILKTHVCYKTKKRHVCFQHPFK